MGYVVHWSRVFKFLSQPCELMRSMHYPLWFLYLIHARYMVTDMLWVERDGQDGMNEDSWTVQDAILNSPAE